MDKYTKSLVLLMIFVGVGTYLLKMDMAPKVEA